MRKLQYYVYAYLRDDGSPYYIGKGTRNRAYDKNHSVKIPSKDRIVFLETNLSNIGACALERRYIKWYGKKIDKTGILRNITDGGEGNTGPRSKEWRENHSKMMFGKKLSNEHIEKIKKMDKGYMKTDEYRKKMSEAQKGKKISESVKRKISKTMKQKFIEDPKKRERYSQIAKKLHTEGKIGFKNRIHSEETKQKMRKAHAKRNNILK